jgi:hypothetical protein
MVCPVHSHIISNVDLNLPVRIDDEMVTLSSMTNELTISGNLQITVGCVAGIDDIALVGLVLVEVVATFNFVMRCRVLEVVHFRCDVN